MGARACPASTQRVHYRYRNDACRHFDDAQQERIEEDVTAYQIDSERQAVVHQAIDEPGSEFIIIKCGMKLM